MVRKRYSAEERVRIDIVAAITVYLLTPRENPETQSPILPHRE